MEETYHCPICNSTCVVSNGLVFCLKGASCMFPIKLEHFLIIQKQFESSTKYSRAVLNALILATRPMPEEVESWEDEIKRLVFAILPDLKINST